MELRRFVQEEIYEAHEEEEEEDDMGNEMDYQDDDDDQAESVDGESRAYDEDQVGNCIRMRFVENVPTSRDDDRHDEEDSLSHILDEVLVVEVVVRI